MAEWQAGTAIGWERFGMLLVVEPAGFAKGRALWRCVCDCGATDVIRSAICLQQGKKKSCGCATGEMVAAAKRTHGQAGGGRTSIYAALEEHQAALRQPEYAGVAQLWRARHQGLRALAR